MTLAWLCQIDAVVRGTGAAAVLRLASHDDDRLCHLNGQIWWPSIARLPVLRRDRFDGNFGGTVTAPEGEMEIAVDGLAGFAGAMLAGARFRLWSGTLGAAFADFTLRFDGRVSAQPQLRDAIASLAFRVDDRWLDEPLLPIYAGTGGAEGEAALKGQPKPLLLGSPRMVDAVLVNSVDTVQQLSASAITGLDAAMENVVRFPASPADYASYAALVAADILPGFVATCLAEGLVRHGAPPDGVLTYDVRGLAGSPFPQRAGAIVSALAARLGHADKVAADAMTAIDAARPWNLSLALRQQTTLREVAQRIAASINAAAEVGWTGKLALIPIDAPAVLTARGTLAADGSALPAVEQVTQLPVAEPWWRLAQQAEVTHRVHGPDEIRFFARPNTRGRYDAAETYREGDMVDLADGSQWIYANPVAASGNAPIEGSAYWSLLSPSTPPSVVAPSPPTESPPGFIWHRASDRRQFVRQGERILIDGQPLLIDGQQLVIPELWEEVKDAAIDAAQAAADAAAAAASGAAVSATEANARIAAISNDALLTPDEKPRVIMDRDVILAEQAGIDAQAVSFGIGAPRTAYNNAVAALTTYLATLTSPVLWSNLSGDTTIVGADFRAAFGNVYTAKQALLDAIAAAAKALADGVDGRVDIIVDTTLPGMVDLTEAAQATADAAASAASDAATSAATANSRIAAISNDALLTPDEKPRVIMDRDVILAEQSGIDAQAAAYGITTTRTAYNDAVTALTTYLATLTSPVLWSNLSGDTTIVGADFRTAFGNVYTAKQALLNAIAAAAKVLADEVDGRVDVIVDTTLPDIVSLVETSQAAADAAASTAAGAATAAEEANSRITAISSDGLLTPNEKPRVIQDRDVIVAEQAGIDAQAASYGVTTERTAYNAAVTALTSYLATLTSPVLWSNLSGDTTIVGSTFRSNFAAVYTAKQALLDAIAAAAKVLADAAANVPPSVVASTPPDDVGLGFIWHRASDRRQFVRLGERILIDGQPLLIDGDPLVIPGLWEEVKDGAIDTAQAAADAAAAAASGASAAATEANSRIAAISNDALLTPDEKPRVIMDRDVILAEQAGIDAQAAAFSITTTRTAYNNAVSAMTTYLATLTSPVLWSNLSGDTAIVGADFRASFGNVYTTKQALLDAIAAAARARADAAQTTADGRNRTFRQTEAPSGAVEGDIWYDTDNGNAPYRRTGGSWVLVQDQAGPDAITLAGAAQTAADAAAAAAVDAQATADGKIDSFYQATAPGSASEGDIWFDTDDGNKQYRRTSGSWTAVQDAAIGDALTAAAGAQATADGKVTTFVSETAPTAEGVGDLWYKPSTGELRRWSGSSWGSTIVDLTAAQQVSQDVDVSSLTFQANHTGALLGGQLPRTFRVKRWRGVTDVSADATWSILSQAGITGVTVTVAGGLVTVPSGSATVALSGSIVVKSLLGGVERLSTVSFSRSDSAPPASGGGSSGTTVSDNTLDAVSGISFVSVSNVMTVKTGPAGKLNFATPVATSAFEYVGQVTDEAYPVECRWRWRPVGGSWTNLTAVESAPDAEVTVFIDPDDNAFYSFVEGQISGHNPEVTGLSASADYEVELQARRTASIPANTVYLTGTVSCTGN